jgi:myo-inositol-1(or 4)-monophosphatase
MLDRALDTAVRAARNGGAIARERLGRPGYLKWKGRRDVVSESTLRVQQAIVSTILTEFPEAGILAEEGPEDAPLPVDAEHLWIIDPVCGTLNYIQGIPFFAIAIALRSAGAIRVGVVYDPCRDELFAATAGGAATLDGRRITVQQISEGIDAWSSAVIGTDLPRGGERRRQARLILGLMADQVSECYVMGSPALGLCGVAAGRLHAYWHLDLNIWDIAAASLILEQAGALLTDVHGMSWIHSDGGYLATNIVVHNYTMNCIKPFLDEPGAPSEPRVRTTGVVAVRPDPPIDG